MKYIDIHNYYISNIGTDYACTDNITKYIILLCTTHKHSRIIAEGALILLGCVAPLNQIVIIKSKGHISIKKTKYPSIVVYFENITLPAL